MIPNIELLTQEITEVTYPSRTYKIVFNKSASEKTGVKSPIRQVTLSHELNDYDRIDGYTDNLAAVIQAIYLILSTERYQYIIYSWDYGVELVDLIGKPMPYVMAELPRRITEALTQDDRIDTVKDFEFEHIGKKLHTTFTVITNVGNVSAALEVNI